MQLDVLRATTEIVSAFLTRNSVAVTDLATLITGVAKALDDVAPINVPGGQVKAGIPRLPPGLHATDLVHDDHVVCALCDFTGKTLGRHLKAIHHMDQGEYRAKFGLPPDFPLIAPAYTNLRSSLAKQFRLGHKRTPHKSVGRK